MIAAIHPVAGLLKAVETFQADAQPLAQLPDDVCAGIMAGVIEFTKSVVSSCSELSWQTAQIHIAIRDGRPELVVPSVREAGHRAPILQGLEVAVAIESGVAVEEACVVPLTAYTVTVNTEQLD